MSLAPYRLEHRWKELLAAQFWSNLITKKVSAAGSVPDAVLKKLAIPRGRAQREEKKSAFLLILSNLSGVFCYVKLGS